MVCGAFKIVHVRVTQPCLVLLNQALSGGIGHVCFLKA